MKSPNRSIACPGLHFLCGLPTEWRNRDMSETQGGSLWPMALCIVGLERGLVIDHLKRQMEAVDESCNDESTNRALRLTLYVLTVNACREYWYNKICVIYQY